MQNVKKKKYNLKFLGIQNTYFKYLLVYSMLTYKSLEIKMRRLMIFGRKTKRETCLPTPFR